MRQKELRIALVCYGGVSLAVYMHGVTKELWKLARASRAYHGGAPAPGGSEVVYHKLLERIERPGLSPEQRLFAGELLPGTSARLG